MPDRTDAAAEQHRKQAPGWYRLMVGDVEVTALSDGTMELPVTQLLHGPSDRIATELAQHFQRSPLVTSDNAWLLNTGNRLILVDAGAGTVFGPTLGELVTQIRAAGYTPEQVDDVLITHLHPDHVGGLSLEGKRVFPNATVHVAKADVDFWLSKDQAAKAPANSKMYFDADAAALAPYIQAGKLTTFDKDGEVVPGVHASATPGHTPGHTIYLLESRNQRLAMIGDLIHVAAVQLDSPHVTISFDTDEKMAERTRARTFLALSENDSLVAVSHFSFPGLGRLRHNGDGWTWVPVDYSNQVR